MMRLIIALLLITFISSYTQNKILSQWRGPTRDGIYPEKNLLKKWPNNGPDLVWKVDGLGEGFASIATANDRTFTTGMIDRTGYVFAFDFDGKLLWKKSYGQEWYGSYPGARCTPIIVDNYLYIESGYGLVVCMRVETGKILWSLNILEKFNAPNIQWGMVESLLINGDRLYCTPAGPKVSMVALNRFNGKTIWKSPGNGENSAYCSPLLIDHNKKQIIVTMTQRSILAVDADTGEFLWRFPHRTPWDIHANTPIYKDGFIYFFSGEGSGGALLKLSADGKKVTKIWRNRSMDSLIGGAVLIDGNIYGSGYLNGGWQCLEWKTGKAKYDYHGIRRGNIIFTDGLLYCYSESGKFTLVKTNPDKFDIQSSFKIREGSGPHWAHPVIKGGRLYIRHGNALMVYDVSDSL